MSRVQNEEALYDFTVIEHYANGEKAYQTTLRRVSGRASGEAMVIQVDESIIRDHNDIFTTPIVDFVVRLLNCAYDEENCRRRVSRKSTCSPRTSPTDP